MIFHDLPWPSMAFQAIKDLTVNGEDGEDEKMKKNGEKRPFSPGSAGSGEGEEKKLNDKKDEDESFHSWMVLWMWTMDRIKLKVKILEKGHWPVSKKLQEESWRKVQSGLLKKLGLK